MDYCIAYRGKDGSGFGSSPWIIDDFDDFEKTAQTKERLIIEGFQEVTIFQKSRRSPEEITWEYVRQHACDVSGAANT